MEKVTIYYSIQNGGDGSAHLSYFRTEAEAEKDQEDMAESWGEPCTGFVDTYVGSDTYNAFLLHEEWRKEEEEEEDEYEG